MLFRSDLTVNMPPRKSTSTAGAPVMDDKNLIDLVRTHECLYNMHSRQYKDDIMKTNCWSKIADEIGRASCRERV